MAAPAAVQSEAAGDDGIVPLAARWALGLATAVLWFFLAGLSSVMSQTVSAAFRDGRASAGGAAFFLGALSIIVLLAPALPLTAWWGRERLATGAALVAFGAGILHASLDGPSRSVAAMVTFVAASFFLVATVGVANRRAIAGGFIGAFALRELLHLAGLRSAGFGTQPSLVVAAVIAALGAWCLHGWRTAPRVERGDSFERRAGGLRLRGALALGAILFFELSYGIGMGVAPGPLAAAASVAATSLAWLLVVRGIRVQRHRLLAVALAIVATLGALLGHVRGLHEVVTTGSLVIAHAAALLLLDRALAPVSGRRSGGNLAIGLLLLAVLTLGAALGWALAGASVGPIQAAGWALVAGLVLTVSMHLTPRPALATPALPRRIALTIAVTLPLVAALAAAL
ncbi:MAG TPA: hypothetical protein VMN78_00855 [Longimicrobiales bacterium]|nr:hypothetical protein [Longimicrobiales bacterium]